MNLMLIIKSSVTVIFNFQIKKFCFSLDKRDKIIGEITKLYFQKLICIYKQTLFYSLEADGIILEVLKSSLYFNN